MNVSDYEQYLLFFNRTVLCHYRASPDLYLLEEDDMGGELSTCGDSQCMFRVRFGFRRFEDSRVCVAAFLPDVEKLPEQDQLIWRGHMVEAPVFARDDPAFNRWVKCNLEGSWVEGGPRVQIEKLVRLIRALTHQTLRKPLWRVAENPLINYPVAENTDAYAKAHLELYGLLVDGLEKDALCYLADRRGVELSCPQRTLNSLKELLPKELIEEVHGPLKTCSTERQKVHGVHAATSFAAFDAFHQDLLRIETGLRALNDWLQKVLSADSEACLEREGAMATLFPKIVGPAGPERKLADLQRAQGKTIGSVEFGQVGGHPDVHQSEAIVLHFTDGSSVCIRVGSNAMNLSHKFKGLTPQDVDTDLMVFWAPAIARVPEPDTPDSATDTG